MARANQSALVRSHLYTFKELTVYVYNFNVLMYQIQCKNVKHKGVMQKRTTGSAKFMAT